MEDVVPDVFAWCGSTVMALLLAIGLAGACGASPGVMALNGSDCLAAALCRSTSMASGAEAPVILSQEGAPRRSSGPGSMNSVPGRSQAQKFCCSDGSCSTVPENTTSCGSFQTAKTCDDDGGNCETHPSDQFPD